jgi:glycosyltransferase involved in cell wall biosynthesis
MKFLVIASYAESLFHFRGHLLRALQSKGLQVHVVAPNFSENIVMRNHFLALGIVVHSVSLRRTGINPITDIFSAWQLWRLILRIKPTYVMGYTIKPVIYGIMAAWLANVPHRFALITGLGYAFQGQSKARAVLRVLAKQLYSLALRRTHKVFFQNPDDQSLFCSLKLLSSKTQTCVINGSGVDLSYFSVVPLPSRPYFLLIARLLGDKGVREYAQAAQRILSLYPHARFYLVGWLDENPDAIKQSEIDSWVRSGTLNYLGRLSDVRPAIEASSVYVLPSYREGTPRTVLEAMAMGRAIITTDTPGCRETVIEGDNGFLVPVQSVDALAEAMARFITDHTLAARMGLRSRQLAEDKYDVHKVNAVMLKEMGLR